MDFQTVIQAVTTVGFPIVVCLIMIFLNEKQDERHTNEMQEIKKALENNTLAITKLVDKLDVVNTTNNK